MRKSLCSGVHPSTDNEERSLSDDIDEVEDSDDEAPKSPSANETFEFDYKAEKAQTKKVQEKLKQAQKTRPRTTPVKRSRKSDDEAEQEQEEEDLATKVQDLVERKTKRRRSTVNDSPGGAWKSCLSGTPTKGKFTAAENKILLDAIQAFCAVRIRYLFPFLTSFRERD